MEINKIENEQNETLNEEPVRPIELKIKKIYDAKLYYNKEYHKQRYIEKK